MNNLFKKIFYYIITRIIYLRGVWSGYRLKSVNYKDIPIIINNFNRVSSLRDLISFLENKGYTNIYIIDNASTYPPLLEYYKTTPYKVFHLDKNTGSRALWKTGIYKQFQNNFFVYSDSDILPVEECPEDFLDHFRKILLRNRYSSKVGFGLKIDDLPSHYRNRDEVVEWEKRFWVLKAGEDLYRAPVDTTFALYRPFGSPKANWYIKNFRTGGNYVARHIPWYCDSENLTEEESFYIKNCKTVTHWTKK